MPTGKKVSVLPASEIHAAVVQKTADLGLAVSNKSPRFRPVVENLDAVNALLVASGKPTKKKVQFVPQLDTIEWMTSI